VRLERVSSTSFSAELPAGSTGSYAVGVQVRSASGATLLAGATVATQSYSDEYRPGPAERASLDALAELSGGRAEIAPARAFDKAGLVSGRGRVSLAGWLLLAAALLWPLAVALSRLALTGSVTSARRALPSVGRFLPSLPTRPGRERPPPPPPPAAPEAPPPPAPPPTVGRLLDRKRSARPGGG
jgi:hypothetical protein